MLIRPTPGVKSSEITPERLYLDRRDFLQTVGWPMLGAAAASVVPGSALIGPADAQPAIPNLKKSAYTVDEKLTPFEDVTTYNNFYEFGVDKEDPARNAHTLKTRPWTVKIDGFVKKPGDYAIDDLIKNEEL